MTRGRKYTVVGVMALAGAALIWVMIQVVAVVVGLLLVPVVLGLILAYLLKGRRHRPA